MQSFLLTTISKAHHRTINVVLAIPTIILAIEVLPKGSSKVAIVICFIILFTVYRLIAENYSKQEVEIVIKENYIDIIWIKLPVYQKKENVRIFWNEIDNYWYEKEKEFNVLVIKQTNGKKLSLAISKTRCNKLFNDFIDVFKAKVEESRIT